MKSTLVLAIALAAGMAIPTLAVAQEAVPQYKHTVYHRFHHNVHHHVHHFELQPAQAAPAVQTSVVQPAPAPSLFPAIAPYPNNKGDEDGLSEDVNDCNTGCIDGNPN